MYFTEPRLLKAEKEKIKKLEREIDKLEALVFEYSNSRFVPRNKLAKLGKIIKAKTLAIVTIKENAKKRELQTSGA